MYVYAVTVKANMPYPIEKQYRVTCWKLWTAISRGIQLFRAEPQIKRRKLSDVSVKGYRIAGSRQTIVPEDPLIEEPEEDYVEVEMDPKERKRIEDQIAKNTILVKDSS